MSAGEHYDATACARYEVDCEGCGDVTRVDHDPAGEDVECDVCGATLHVVETR